MLTDEVKIEIMAGSGGDGASAFSKVKMELGPTGGRGGNGGNIYFEGVSDISALKRFRHQKKFEAEKGHRGKNDRSDGKTGEDLTLLVPIGSLITKEESGEKIEIVEVGQKVLAAKGGIGGRGNFYFRSPVNTSPKESEEGKPGEKFSVSIELRLIADAGLIGLPSAGKSSLLNELTKADVKVGAYHFTTLEPNLGAMEGGTILADIPGLIEGASAGRGLGIKFLRHIQRTEVLLHCLSLESEHIEEDYEIIRKELGEYSSELLKKKEIVLLTKTDLVSEETRKNQREMMKKKNPDIWEVSIHDLDSLEKLKERLREIVKK
ncbi:MAG: Obg family GTPase CgtA [Patescibacteria group bacterium]